MAPIGEPIDVLGTNPIFAKPKPFLPPQTPKRPPVNKTGPVLPRIKPPIIPPRPPSIGGVGGIGSGKPMPINVPGGGGINYGGGEGPPLLPLQPPSIGRPPPPISIGRPPSIGRPIPISGQPIQPMPIAPPGQLIPPMDPADPRSRPISGEPPSRFGPDSFYSMFPDAPQPPQMMTSDMAMWTNPITGQQETGSSSMRQYQNRLKEYLDANPAAQESYTQNVTSIAPPPTNQGPVLGRPSGGRPTPPISIGGPGGGITSIGQPLDGSDPGLPRLPGGQQPVPPQDFGFGPGIRPTEIFDEQGNIVVGSGGVTPPSGDTPDDPISGGTNIGNILNNPTTPESVVDPVNTPVSSMPMGAIDPVLLQQQTSETLTDPLLRSLYFGTQDQPGFYQQLQQAGANLIGQDVPLQQTAGLTPLELLARQQAVAGIGGFEPFFQQNKDLIDQAIGQSRRAEALRDPYFQRAEQQMLLGLGDQLGGIDEARGITLGATDRFGRSLGRLGRQQIGATGQFGQRMGDIEADARGSTDIFGRNLDATQAGLTGQVDQFGQRLGNVEGLQAGATDQFGRRLSDVEARGEGAAGRFGETLGGIETGAIGSTGLFGRRLGESEDLIRGTLGGYDQGLTQQFYNPFEDAVVQQTIEDVMEAGDKQDIAARAREISSGAFGGSRARLGAEERRQDLGEGLAKALSGIRQTGFTQAQQTGLGEFARQKAAERSASEGLSGLAGTRFGAESGLFDRLTSGAQQRLAADQGVVDLLGKTGQQQLGAQQALANLFQSTAGQRLGAGQSLAEFQRGTAGQQLASQQALQNLLQSSAGQQLGAQQQLGSTLRGLTGDQFGAQQQLASSLMGYGSAGAGARQNLASGLLGIGQQRGAGAQQLGQSLAGFGQQIGGIGSSLDALRRGERGELAGYGSIGRGIAETGLGRIYEQQVGQQMRPLGVLGQIGSMLPGYQASQTQIDSGYGMPTDPSAAGLGAAFSAYGALAPRQGSS